MPVLVDEDVSAVLVMSHGAVDEAEAVLRIEGLHPTLSSETGLRSHGMCLIAAVL